MGKKVAPKESDDVKPIAFVKGKKPLKADSSSESESDTPAAVQPIKAVRKISSDSAKGKKKTKLTTGKVVEESSSSESDAPAAKKVVGKGGKKQESSSESEEEKVPIKVSGKKPAVKKPESSSESSEPEPPKKAQKPVAKPVKKAKLPSSSSESEEEEKPVKKPVTTSGKKTKPVVSSSESESEEEKKVPVKSTPAKKPEPASAKKPEPASTKKPESASAKKPEPTSAKKPEPASTKKPAAKESSSEESDSDEPKTKKPVAKATPEVKKSAAKGKKEESESSESSEEETKKKPAKAGKKPAKESDDSEDSEEPAPKVPSKRNPDSSEDSEEEAPKKIAKPAETPSASKRPRADETTPAPGKAARIENSTQTEVFIGGLAYQASEDDIRQLFAECGTIENIKLLTNQDGTFKGAGFVEFSTAAEASSAVAYNGSEHMGRTIKVNLANEKPAVAKPEGGVNTVFVGNISFDSTEDTLANFFSKCGTVSQVRLARGPDGKIKGFAHVEFESNDGADKAVQMAGQKLDGRPLRVDYAQARGESGGSPRRGGFGGGFGGGRRGGFDSDRGKEKMKKSGAIQPFQGQKIQL